ncbi:NAD(P)H-binding protein [Dactylosporangium sp. NPDC048998]|uniref:NmrA family NAD(P)-binding protein n=1 Tax=Dactylosporangium sp. NPDC048998 TaxID=3363976 RepID=UPI00371809BD
MTILVTGATGTLGRAVVRQLLDAGARVRALTRDPARAGLPADVEVVAGDLGDPATLPAATSGVRQAFVLSIGPDKAGHDRNLARAAAAAGVGHLVALSSLAVQERPLGRLGRWHADGEAAVREAGPDWTIVRPNGFMSNALDWAPPVRSGGLVRAPYADLPAAVVDPRDIAAVVVRALLDGHAGRVHAVTGPEALTPARQAAILADVLGREVRFAPLTHDEALDAMARRMPRAVAEAVLEGRANGDPLRARVSPAVEEVTGSPPRTFRTWVTDHALSFA